MSNYNKDDDDTPQDNICVYRESNDINQVYKTRHQHHNLLFNLGYQTNSQEEHGPLVSYGWLVCMWSVVSTLDLVWRDMINEGAEMRMYYRREGQELYHIVLPTRQSRAWVTKKIFIPEQIVYAIPAEQFNNEFILPDGLVQQLATVQRDNTNRLLWDHHHRSSESTSFSDDKKPLLETGLTSYPSFSNDSSE